MPLLNKTYTPTERKWLSEYLAGRYPNAKIWYEKKLTQVDVAAQKRMGAGVKPRAASRIVAKLDAWVVLDDEIAIWEAKQYGQINAVSQLHAYELLLPSTWEGANHVDRPLTFHVLASAPNHVAGNYAKSVGIEWVVWRPQWLYDAQMESQRRGAERRAEYLQKLQQQGQNNG